MKVISDIEFKRLMLIDFENERLKTENSFLKSKVQEYKIAVNTKESDKISAEEGKNINDKLILWKGYLVEDLGFDSMCRNALLRSGIKTAEALVDFANKNGTEKFLQIRCIGKKAHDQIVAFLTDNDLLFYK